MAWKPSKTKCGVAICNCPAHGQNGLGLSIGETVHILEDFHAADNCITWYRGKSLRSKGKMGVFPATCVTAKPFKVENEGQYETVTPSQDSTVKEVGYILNEWCPLWKKLYLTRNKELFYNVGKVMHELVRLRRKLLSDTVTNDQVREVKQRIISRIDWGNRNLGLEFVPRMNDEQVEPEGTSAVQLYRIHAESTQAQDTLPTDETDSRLTVLKPAHTYHILFHLKGFVCNIGDDAEIYISLYDANLNCHISERFLAVYTKNGIPVDIEKIHDYRALFTSLGYSDLQKDLYIVAHVYRRGKMKLSESSKKAPSKVQYIYKRPYGCAAHSLREFLQSVERNQETEFYMKVQSCNENESQFPLILENIIKKQTQGGRYITSGSPTQTLVGSLLCLDGDLQEVRLQNPLLFTRPVAIANKLGFPDVIKPADVRNNLYVTLVGGEFEKGEKVAQKKKVAQKNVEATISVFDSDGNLIKESIIGGSGEQPTSEYHSAVFYHNDKPEWNETVDISLNIDQFSGSHIRIDLKHCSTRDRAERKLFGFAFVKITSPEGVTLADGVHNLCVYKCEDLKKLQSPSAYLPLISFLEDQGNPEMMAKLPSKPPFELSRDRFYLASKLCSTKFTQKADLLAVLQWKKNPGRLSVVLEKLQKLDGEEVVQFLQDILDAVFDMFGSPAQMSQNSGPLFNAFVYILNLLKQPKFENFIPVLDTYISTTFSASSMYKDLVVCMKDVINQAIKTSNGTSLVQTFEVLDYLFKVLVRSRQLARTMSLGGDQEFSKDIQSLVHTMGSLLSLNVQSLQQAQESLLQHMFGCCEVLEQVLSQRVVCILLCDLLKSCREARGTFLIAKTGLLRDCVNSQLFRMHECRKVLLPLCKAQIKKCLIQKGGVVPCTNLLADILHCLSTLKQEKMDVYEDVKTLVLALFDVVMQTAQHYEAQYDEPEQHKVAPLVACIIEMLQLMEDSHYSEVLQSYPKGKPMKQFLIRVLTTFQELIKANIFPQDWFVMKMVTNNVILTAVQYFAQALTDHFHEDLDFDYQIWSSYFHLAVAFITQPSLQLETFSEGKRQKIIDKYGDMRVLLGFQIQTLWQSLENQKHWFIPHLIGPFLQITMVPEAELRKATIPIFYDMMECEHQRKGHFKEVENEVILQLDHLVTSNKGDVEYKQLFKKILEEKLRGNMGLKESGTAFIRAITNLLEQLLDYRQVLDGEENRDKRMHCTFNILNFYKADGNRTEMYMRYIDKLHCLHVDAQNFVEAGFTLLLYADLLPAAWEDDPLPAELSYPPQRVWERKEALYKDIIEHFDKGKAWEYSIPLCKQLAHLYENKCYDYKKLSDILQKQARFFTNILEGPALRQSPAYYRIAYYGQSFPPFVRNKEFVYRGEECQRLGVLIHQLQTEFPSATIMSTNTPPEDSIKQGQAQFIQICIVKPVPKSRPDFVENSVPTEIQQFYKANEVDTFQLDIPCHRGEKDKNNEFKTLCIERTILQTAFTLPGILRSFEVVSTRKVSLTPIEVAIERMNEVNMELRSLIDKCRMKPTDHFNQLEMRLNGVISAKVNGGIPVFQEAFFTAEFPQQHPEEAKHLGTLKATLVEQIQLLETGLKLHGMIAPPSLQPLHKSLEDNFRGLKRTVRESGSPAFSHSLHSSPASSGGRPHTGSMQSLTSTPPSSNRSSTTSGDIGVDINLMRFEDDDIYTEAEDYETVPSLPKKRQSLSSSQSSLSTTSLSSTASSRPQSVLMEGESPKAKEMSRSSINASDSNLLASRVPPASAQTDKAVLTNSRSTESIRPRPTVPSSSLRRQASDPDTSIGADGEKAPPLPVRRPTTGSPRAMTLASPVNGKASPPPAAPRLARKPSGGQLGVLAEDRLSSVQENSTPNGTSRAPGAAPPIPPKAQAKVPPQVPPPIPCARPTISSRRPPPPPRKNSQNESSVEDNTKL